MKHWRFPRGTEETIVVIGRILSTLFAFAIILVLVPLAVANRHLVQLGLDPFNPENPAIGLEMPFFYFLFGALILGVLVGGTAVWMSQGKWRKLARQRTQEALRWKGEVDRLTRERDDHVQAAKKLAATTPTAERSLAIAGR